MPSQQVLDAKSAEVEAIKDLLQEYKFIGVASLPESPRNPTSRTKKEPVGQGLHEGSQEHPHDN